MYERVRDYAAEERAKGNDAGPRYTWINTVVHRMEGTIYFAQASATELLRQASAVLWEIRRAARDTSEITTNQMAIFARRLREAIDGLTKVREMYLASVAFFQPRNLAAVASWATRADHVDGSYEARRGEIHSLDQAVHMALPASYQPLDEHVLALLLRRPRPAAQASGGTKDLAFSQSVRN